MELSDIRAVTVLGLRESGLAAALLACRRLGVPVTAVDDKPAAELQGLDELRAAGVVLLLGEEAALPGGASLLVKSPGVPLGNHVVQAALAAGVPIWSEVELASRFLDNRVVGITGTNGKTTTTELTGALLRDAGLQVVVAGNMGHALARVPDEAGPEAIVVAELSSFQLENIERFRAQVGVLLNVTEDHLDRHGSLTAYAEAKLRVFENQDAGCVALVNGEDERAAALAVPGAGRRAYFAAACGRRPVPAAKKAGRPPPGTASAAVPSSSPLTRATQPASWFSKRRSLACAYACRSPCRSRWSSVTFSSTPTSARKRSMCSSWKLESSATTTVPAPASSGTRASACPMLPATTTGRPASRSSAPMSSVVVVLPFVPVMPTMRHVKKRAASSTSLHTGMPAVNAACTT